MTLGVHTVRLAAQGGAFDRWKAERHYVAVARLVRATTDTRSVILSMQHSGSIRYYAGRITMRYDLLDSQWLDRAVDWLSARKIRPYLLIDKWEEPYVHAAILRAAYAREVAAGAGGPLSGNHDGRAVRPL